MWQKIKTWWQTPKEHTKAIVNFLLANGVIWVYLSYLLAYLGREEIAETLSKAVVTEIIGVFMIAAGKATVENLSKHNAWPDKPANKEDNGNI